jgi:hypothetical protein
LIGVDDGCKGRTGEAIFRISVDGKEVFKSDVLLPGQTPKPVDIPIAGAKELKLIIEDEGDGHGGDWGDWLNARLVNSKTGEFMFLTDLVPEERAWIASNKDRNIIYNKLSVDGKTFARGWGCISGDEMIFRNWSQVAADREASVDKANAEAAKRVGPMKLKMIGSLPSGLSILVDGKPIGGSVKADSALTITTDSSNKAHTDWWKSGKCTVVVGSTTIPFVDLIQPTDRIILKDIYPNRLVLTGEAPAETQAYWNDRPMPGSGSVTFTVKDIPMAVERISTSRIKVICTLGGLLMIQVKQFKTSEAPELRSITSSLLTLVADGKLIAYVFSDNETTWTQNVPINEWPKKLQCVTTAGADGNLGDGFVIDIGIRFGDMKEPLWLRDIQPSYNKFDYRSAKKMLMAGGWELPGSGVARWDNLSQELVAQKAGLDALPAAETKIKAAKDAKTIYKIVDEVLALDPKQSDIRIVAANRLRELGDLEHEREQWGLINEASRADLALMQKARMRMDEIWAVEDPEPFVYPDTAVCPTDCSMIRRTEVNENRKVTIEPATIPLEARRMLRGFSSRETKQSWTGKGDFMNHIWSITLDKDKGWKDEVTFPAPSDKRIGILVNSLGAEVTAALSSGDKIIATKTARFPMLDVDLVKAGVKAGTPLKLTISLEPDVTGIILTHDMEVAAWPINSEADLPNEDWSIDIRNDGSANVYRTSKAPVIAAVPRTAVKLTVDGATGYTIQEPIAEYLVEMDGRLHANLPFLAIPKPGETVSVSYIWPDAAYNVSPSRLGWSGRKDHCYLSTPSALINTEQKSAWHATWPKDWTGMKSTPEPAKDLPHLFFVDPKGGLNAEWEAKDVMTPWIVMSHKNLNFYAPDNPNNQRWFPLWMKYVRRIYDVESKISGHEHPFMIYIAPTGPGQLSGYGGASVADKNASETWVAATGRMCPQTWRYGDNVTGVDAHELHWIFLNCRTPGSPTWTDSGFGSWLEQIGWESACLANTYRWRRTRMESLKPSLEMIKASGKNPIQSEGAAWDALPNDIRVKMIHLGWYISDELYKAYGEEFWAKFWAEEWKLYADIYPILSDRAKQILFVDELARVSGDPKLRDRFTNEWLFDLTPDPQDALDRFLILPRSPSVTMEDKPEFASPTCEDYSWLSASGVGIWDEKVPTMKGYRGIAWYRYTFDVPADFKTENLELLLGHITNADEVYLNGEKIGFSDKFPPDWVDAAGVDRVYKIKPGVLKPGECNVLAIRIFATQGSGGIEERPRIISRINK